MEILVGNCLELGLLEGGQDLGGVEAGEGGDVEAGQPGNHGAGLVPRVDGNRLNFHAMQIESSKW